MRKAPLGKNEIRKSLSIKAKNAGLQLEGKRVTNHSCQENLYFKAPRCRYSGKLCGPTEKEFTRSRILQSYIQSASYNHQKRRSMILSNPGAMRLLMKRFSKLHALGLFDAVFKLMLREDLRLSELNLLVN